MAFVHSVNTRVFFNTIDISGYLNEASLDATVDVAESTTFGNAGRTYVPGLRDRTFTAAGRYDPTAQAVVEAALTAGTGTLTFCPGGAAAIGDLSWMASVIETTLTPSSNIADVVAFAWDAQTTGGASYGYVLHPLAEDTNTTTGAIRDDAAATTTGWVAHLHVTAVDGGSWVIKIVDGADSGLSDVADLSGAAFTAATGATSQRLVSAAGATVKRYLRYVATRTGGSGGDGITFHLSLSRFRIA